ncbi:MAG: hydrogenase [Planctomycetes bacterium]|nr:hydrogenase [Planctomycetota bacterium]
MPEALQIRNGQALPEESAPLLRLAEWDAAVRERLRKGARLVLLFGRPVGEFVRLYAVLGQDSTGGMAILRAEARDAFPSLTPEFPQAHLFERELAEQWSLRPEGHPWLKPVRFHAPYRVAPGAVVGKPAGPIPTGHAFFAVEGEEVHEVAVGPVHAGTIEPGHFRFQCAGERVLHLEIALGYQHRGAERMLEKGPDRRTAVGVESLSGDTAVGHALAWCQAMEALAACKVPARAQALRGVALELERLSNHVGDLGALGTDIGFLPAAAWFGRLRGEFLNELMEWSGNRFGRGLLRPGGVALDLPDAMAADFRRRLARARAELERIAGLFFGTATVLARLEGTGTLSKEVAKDLGLVGPAARACGLSHDVRQDYPVGIYRFVHLPISVVETGDVLARAMVRWLETQRSLEFLDDQLSHVPEGQLRRECGPLAPDSIAVSMVEGWRGELVHAVVTGPEGRFVRYKPKDPSFHNWTGLAMALRGQQISDFPLCNKSFNLAYAGTDL